MEKYEKKILYKFTKKKKKRISKEMATRVTDSSSSSLGLYLRTNPIRALEWKGGERGKEGGTRRESVKASRPFSLFPMLLFFLLPSASANLLHLSWSSCRLITYCLTARKSTMPPLSTTFVSTGLSTDNA